MKTITMTNNKGGVGKTTSAVNIAFLLVLLLRQAGARLTKVLLVDTDSQAHSTLLTTGRAHYADEHSLVGVLRASRQDAGQILRSNIVRSFWDDDLHVLPGSPNLDEQERNLIGVSGAVYRLDDVLKEVENDYAAVLIDTRPSFSLLTEMALVASTDAIVPVEPRYLESVGLTAVVSKVYEIREAWRQPKLRVSGIVVTKYDGRISGHQDVLRELQSHEALGPLLLGVVPVNEAVSYAHANHMSIVDYDARSVAAGAYAKVVNKIVRKIFAGA